MSPHPLVAADGLRTRWRSGEATFGAWIHLRDPFGAEIVGRAGFDWACIDTQHGMARAGDVLPLLQALGLAGIPAIVRVPWNEPGVIMNALDVGASGVIIPMVGSAADARRAVAACRYPPAGMRSWGPTRAALATPEHTASWANDRVLCIVMVETADGAANIDEILSVPGIDAVFLGFSDLALAFGVSRGSADNSNQVASLCRSCQAGGMATGTATTTHDEASWALAQGFAMIALPSDAVLLARACAALLSEVRAT